MPNDSILAQVEDQLLTIPGVDRALAQAAARVVTFGDSLRPRSLEEKAAIHAVYEKLVEILQG